MVVAHDFDFDAPPFAGQVVIHGNQRFVLVRLVPYVRKSDGQPTTLLIWVSHCVDCGAEFELTTGLKAKGPTRRCKAHRGGAS